MFIAGTYLDPDGWPTCYIVSVHLSDDGRVRYVHRRELTRENVELPFRTTAFEMRPEDQPLCLVADKLDWAEDGRYDRVVAEPGAASSLGRKVFIEVP